MEVQITDGNRLIFRGVFNENYFSKNGTLNNLVDLTVNKAARLDLIITIDGEVINADELAPRRLNVPNFDFDSLRMRMQTPSIFITTGATASNMVFDDVI